MSSESNHYPFEIKKLDAKEYEEVFKLFNGESGVLEDFVRIGPKGYWFHQPIVHVAPKIYNMKVRPDDVWVISFPKSGTTLTQELVWQVASDFDYAKAKAIPLMDRFLFIE
ncbi:unnamed protein product [Diatraea saccharalis]|uniref:Sulfotransferase domain-containing protein n=1 Tax=Diatraea saccharalis TaxID=40085 RepID=A0A9N9QV57_9NEOP|nr:unnamed protein product [Diatraea saccharalis]